jgi:hypothetical protein
MKVHCRHCNAVFGIVPSRQGSVVTCPRCRSSFELPVVSAADPGPAGRRRRRFPLMKAVLLLAGAILLLRFGYRLGWEVAGDRLSKPAAAQMAPKHPRPPARKGRLSADDLVEYFRATGMDCTATPGPRVFAPGKASALLDVAGQGWHVALYQFDNDKDAERYVTLEKPGEHPVHRKRNLVLKVIEGEDRVLQAFRQF